MIIERKVFHAKLVSCEEDEYKIKYAFFGGENDEDYFSTNIAEESDENYIELNDQYYACFEGVEQVKFEESKLVFTLNSEGAKNLEVKQLEIVFHTDYDKEELKNRLSEIFKNIFLG